MNKEDISDKKLTLQGFNNNKTRFGVNFGSLTNLNIGATIVKKRKRKISNLISDKNKNKLSSLTEREQIFRITAVQNDALLKEKNVTEESILNTKEKNNNVIYKKKDDNILNFSSQKIREDKYSSIYVKSFKQEKKNEDYDDDLNIKPLKVNKDLYSKHSKLIISQSIDEKNEQNSSIFKQKFSIRNKKSRIVKGKNISRQVIVPDKITIKELSIRMAEDSKNVLKILKEETNKDYYIDEFLNMDIACKIVKKFNHKIKFTNSYNKEKDLFFINNRGNLPKKPKPPIVTFMGHVDHGKTSLLDALRESSVAKKESGGITQHIGAYQVITKNKQKITFIDTPGHEAFTAIRACGANVTNIAIIVIAADDGVMEQTIEAINHAKTANVSIIVAINKIDKSQSCDIEKLINSLPRYNIIPEKLGGDVIVVPVSAKKRINLDKLEEAILLVAELIKLEAIEDCRASGWIIESKVDKSKGILATLIVEEGKLKIGDILVVGTTYGKVRSMINSFGEREKIALPSTPIEITGLNSIPNSGDKFVVVDCERYAREIIEHRLLDSKRKIEKNLITTDLEEIFSRNDNKIEDLNIILKCDVTSSIDAISNSIIKLCNSLVKLNIIHKAVGVITDSDVMLAEASKSLVLAFNIKVDSKVRDLAKQKKVKIRTYNIIYELIEDLKIIINKMLKPLKKDVIVGSAYVKKIFNISKIGNVIGCYIKSGLVKKDSLVKIIRNNKLIYSGKLKALRRFKDDVKEVCAGFECGICLDNNLEIKIGDTLEFYKLIQEERILSL